MTQNTHPVDETVEFDLEIAELESAIFALKQRHADTQLAAQEQVVLTRQRNELKQKGTSHPEFSLIYLPQAARNQPIIIPKPPNLTACQKGSHSSFHSFNKRDSNVRSNSASLDRII